MYDAIMRKKALGLPFASKMNVNGYKGGTKRTRRQNRLNAIPKITEEHIDLRNLLRWYYRFEYGRPSRTVEEQLV